MEDLGKDSTKLHLTNFTATYKKQSPLSPNGKMFGHATSPHLPGDMKVLSEKAVLQSWTDNDRSITHEGTNFQEHNSFGRNSLEDNSWVLPSPPKSSETAFGETKNKTLPFSNLPPLHYLDQHNQNCLYKNWTWRFMLWSWGYCVSLSGYVKKLTNWKWVLIKTFCRVL